MIQLNLRELKKYIQSKENPVPEAALLKHFFPEAPILLDNIDFFRAHFCLYHHLYKLKDEMDRQEGDFLYIRLASIFLFPRPPLGKCQHYDSNKMEFCRQESHGESFCPFHKTLLEQTKSRAMPGYLSMASYYLDESNYEKMNQDELIRLTSGTYQMIGSLEEIEASLKKLSLSADASLDRIKSRYRYLANIHHPDKQGNSKEFQELAWAFGVLKKWKDLSL